MSTYKFNFTVAGTGQSIDDAFQDAIDSFCKDPGDAIEGEVIYAAGDSIAEKEINEQESSN